MTFFQKSKPEGLVALPNIHISCVISYFFSTKIKVILVGKLLFWQGQIYSIMVFWQKAKNAINCNCS